MLTLPKGGGDYKWPPESLVEVYDNYREWTAWFSGRAAQLEAYYGGYITSDRTGFFDPQSTAYPLTSVFRRMFFWARQQPAAITRARYHIPIAGDLATVNSDQLFADPPRLLIPEAHAKKASSGAKKVQARLDDWSDRVGLFATLQEAAEVCAALSGVFLQVTYDVDLFPDFPLINIVSPDCALPEFQWGRLTSVIIWRTVKGDGKAVFRHLELHTPGKITHALYKGTEKSLGVPEKLSSLVETAPYAELAGEGGEIATGITGLDIVYVPNMRPNRQLSRTNLGRSDYQGAEDLMDGADEIWTSLMRDFRLGKARAFVAEEYLQAQGKGKGAQFDIEREVFEVLKMAPEVDASKALTFHQFSIRVDDHLKALESALALVVENAGLSAATFGIKGPENVEQTATQIVAKEHRTVVTRGKKIRYWSPAISDVLQALLQIDSTVFKKSPVGDWRPRADFPEMVHDSLKDSSQAIQFLDAAKAISRRTKVELAHPTWDPDEVQTEVDAIIAEEAAAAPKVPTITSPPTPPMPEGGTMPPEQTPPQGGE